MADASPKFDAPPVVEVVLSAQFTKLPRFSAAHAGWFWKSYLPTEWSSASVKEAPYLPDQIEQFGARTWAPPGPFLRQHNDPDRIQIIREDIGRMLQVQSSRFIYNWRRGDDKSSKYPSFGLITQEFGPLFKRFGDFVRDAQVGELRLNQWEVTYVNFIPRDGLWSTPADWARVVANFCIPAAARSPQVSPENASAEWKYAIEGDRGRLHVTLRLGRVGPEGPEVMVLQLTARGPVDLERGLSAENGFKLGHDAIVWTFAEMTTPEAQARWGRRI